jgi:hypothetical protein
MTSPHLPEEHTATSILDCFEASVEALIEHESSIVRGATLPARYIGLTILETQQTFRRIREELEREVVLALLASLEAELRLDFKNRIQSRKRDSISKAFRGLKKKYGDRVRLDDILGVWKAGQQAKDAFQKLGNFRKRRHWLAHGRYWTDKSGVTTDPYEVCDVFQDLASKVPGFPSLL